MNREEKVAMIFIGVNWWANYLEKPARGDSANGGLEGFGSVLATFAKMTAQKSVTADQIEVFKKSLTEQVAQNIYDTYPDQTLAIGTDWFPEMELAEACRQSGISGTEFPSKTTMWIDFGKGTISVAVGIINSKVIYPVNN